MKSEIKKAIVEMLSVDATVIKNCNTAENFTWLYNDRADFEKFHDC